MVETNKDLIEKLLEEHGPYIVALHNDTEIEKTDNFTYYKIDKDEAKNFCKWLKSVEEEQ